MLQDSLGSDLNVSAERMSDKKPRGYIMRRRDILSLRVSRRHGSPVEATLWLVFIGENMARNAPIPDLIAIDISITMWTCRELTSKRVRCGVSCHP